MSDRQARGTGIFLSSWIVALVVLTGCDSNFDTQWEKPEAEVDAGEADSAVGDAASADAGMGDAGVDMDAALDGGAPDAGDSDGGVVPVLPLQINCAVFVRDASVDASADASSDAGASDASLPAGDGGCEADCRAACLLPCRDAGGCGDAQVWLSCAGCLLEGGIPPPTL